MHSQLEHTNLGLSPIVSIVLLQFSWSALLRRLAPLRCHPILLQKDIHLRDHSRREVPRS
jgi:hypothetical protein